MRSIDAAAFNSFKDPIKARRRFCPITYAAKEFRQSVDRPLRPRNLIAWVM
jgi:hypothetical protein